jgi:serine/threonine protein kinase
MRAEESIPKPDALVLNGLIAPTAAAVMRYLALPSRNFGLKDKFALWSPEMESPEKNEDKILELSPRPLYDIEHAMKQSDHMKISLTSFLLLSVIGKGSYAKVVLVKKIDSGEIFALKILKKNQLEKKNQVAHVQTERDVMVKS